MKKKATTSIVNGKREIVELVGFNGATIEGI